MNSYDLYLRQGVPVTWGTWMMVTVLSGGPGRVGGGWIKVATVV